MRAALVFALALTVATPALAVDAKAVWTKHCKGCHGMDGKADTPMGHKNKTPDLTSAKFKNDPKHDDAHMKDVILNGEPNTKMHPYKNKLSPEEIDAVLGYVHTLQGK